MKKCILCAGLAVASISTASWPHFSYPKWTSIKPYTSTCTHHRVKIAKHQKIPVKFINGFNLNWQWRYHGDSHCQKLETPLPFSHFTITNHFDKNNISKYSTIIAHYQSSHGQHYTLVLNTPKQHWECHQPANHHDIVTCANDTATLMI